MDQTIPPRSNRHVRRYTPRELWQRVLIAFACGVAAGWLARVAVSVCLSRPAQAAPIEETGLA